MTTYKDNILDTIDDFKEMAEHNGKLAKTCKRSGDYAGYRYYLGVYVGMTACVNNLEELYNNEEL